MSRSLIHTLSLSLLALLSAAGCVLSPANNHYVGTPSETFLVYGFGDAASALIIVEAKNKKTGAWVQIATATTTATPTVTEAGWYPGTNTPDLYYYSAGSVALTNLCFWHSSCAIQPGDVSATIRVKQVTSGGTTYLYGGEAGASSCHQARLEGGDDFYAAGYECGFDDTLIVLRMLT